MIMYAIKDLAPSILGFNEGYRPKVSAGDARRCVGTQCAGYSAAPGGAADSI
jgi:hypothetical protein